MEEFYKTIQVGQKVKICGMREGKLCEAIVVVTGLYDRAEGDFGFDFHYQKGTIPKCYTRWDTWWDEDKRIVVGTVDETSLIEGDITVWPCEECEEGHCSSDMLTNEAAKLNDVVNSPNHYIIFKDIEVKDVVKEVLRRWQHESDTEMSFNQAGMMKEVLQYLLRAPMKNKKEDVEKAVYYLKAILGEWEMSKVDYKKVSISVNSVRYAAEFIVKNNPNKVYASVKDAEENIFKYIKLAIDQDLGSIGTAGWTVVKSNDGGGYHSIEVLVDPAVGRNFYVTLEDFFTQEGVSLD